ncbi:MAG: hypothetical protein K2I91_02285, partial [Muribaculaceae bacterium]|nr:hypothetical protein [Muribaculaceae bacterium]
MPATTYWNIDRIMKLIIGLALAAGLIVLIDYLHDVLLPFFVACFIAYLMQPLVNFNRRLLHEKGRVFSSILSLVEVIALIGTVIYLFMPHVISELDTLTDIIHNIT